MWEGARRVEGWKGGGERRVAAGGASGMVPARSQRMERRLQQCSRRRSQRVERLGPNDVRTLFSTKMPSIVVTTIATVPIAAGRNFSAVVIVVGISVRREPLDPLPSVRLLFT